MRAAAVAVPSLASQTEGWARKKSVRQRAVRIRKSRKGAESDCDLLKDSVAAFLCALGDQVARYPRPASGEERGAKMGDKEEVSEELVPEEKEDSLAKGIIGGFLFILAFCTFAAMCGGVMGWMVEVTMLSD